MKIAFDAKRAFQNRTGLGNYSRYVLSILCTYHRDEEYVAYAPRMTDEPQMERLLKEHECLKAAFPRKCLNTALWRIHGISRDLKRDGIDIFHGLSGELPLTIHKTEIRSVVTVHDLIFLRFPQYYSLIDRHIYAYKMRRACQMADKIVAISECTKRDIVHFFGIKPEKIAVVYQGCDTAFQISDKAMLDEDVCKRYALPHCYILSVGSIEERKNALALVRALSLLPAEVHLVLVGKRTPYTTRVETEAARLHVAERLHVLTNVPFSDLPSIYRQAQVFAYPSRYEGFGIPILEALRSGLPVMAATGSCLEEAGGKGAHYVHPDDTDAMADALQRLLYDEHLRKETMRLGQQHLEQFDDKRQAHQLHQIYQSLL